MQAWVRDHAYNDVRADLDSKVFDYFRLMITDRILVSDTVKFVATSIQPPDYERLSTPLLHRPSQPEIENYLAVLASELARWREHRQGMDACLGRVAAPCMPP